VFITAAFVPALLALLSAAVGEYGAALISGVMAFLFAFAER
jgi:hypothetical protein